MHEQPANEVNDVALSSLSHLIGQRGVIDQVSVALDACQMDNRRLDHALLVGSPGLGKSQLANVIAMEMATNLHEVLGQSISHPSDLNALLLASQDKDIVHIDECHELPKQMQTALYLALVYVNDPKFIFRAAAQASKSADFILSFSRTPEPVEEPMLV